MSYDLMVFEKTKAPKTKEEFMRWYEQQTKWREDHDYETPSVASLALQNWYHAMKSTFPPMNGEDAPTDEQFDEDEDLENRITDYSIGRDIIYAAFAWSIAEEAYDLARQLAKQCDVGFFDVSGSDAEIILPEGTKIV